MRLADFNQDEKPREKLIKHGAETLTIEELIALIIRFGTKNISAIDLARLVTKYTGGIKDMLQLTVSELHSFTGMGIAKSASIIAAVELAKRINTRANEDVKITNPADIFNYIKVFFLGKTKEYAYLISLNTRNKVIGIDTISIGTIRETLIHPREVFNAAIKRHAVSIILAHNHPSNDTTPSKEDIEITETIAEAGKILNIPLIDHIIVADDSYLSMKQSNLFSNFRLADKGGEYNV